MLTNLKKCLAIIAFSILFSGCHLSFWENALINLTADAIFWAYKEGDKIKYYSDDADQSQETKTPVNNVLQTTKSRDDDSDTIICPNTDERLQRLKFIYEKGLITEGDYVNKKAEILSGH